MPVVLPHARFLLSVNTLFQENFPGVFAEVANPRIRKWIEDTMRKNGDVKYCSKWFLIQCTMYNQLASIIQIFYLSLNLFGNNVYGYQNKTLCLEKLAKQTKIKIKNYQYYCHTWLHLGSSAKLKIQLARWSLREAGLCREPHPATHPPNRLTWHM